MTAIKPTTTIPEFQKFIEDVYGFKNDRYFSTQDMLTQIERFTMRGLKGIRKKNKDKIKENLFIAFSWFFSLANQLHIDMEEEVWQRFPYLCSYCAGLPCTCGVTKPEKRQKVVVDETKRPKTMEDFQNMFEEIYPSGKRSLEDAGIHLAEELGEFAEAILDYRGKHNDEYFDKVALEAADLFSCYMTTFQSAGINIAKELSERYSENCHHCKKMPCECNFERIMQYKS